MNAAHKLVNKHKSISWLLITAILLVTSLPAHYHLHHLDNVEVLNSAVATHEHLIDLHILTEMSGQSHHDEGTTIIASSPDGIIKKSNADFSPFILLTVVLLLLPALNRQSHVRITSSNNNFKQSYPHFKPLLRAPPLY